MLLFLLVLDIPLLQRFTIQGDGFGAVARATIDTDGENAGRVTGIKLLTRVLDYTQGTTIINLNSIGQGAQFQLSI